jgi:fumarylacetoacetase
MIDQTHDTARRSWVRSANGHQDFPIQNLPIGIFSRGNEQPRGGIAIGEDILDLARLTELNILPDDAATAARAANAPTLNAFFALDAGLRRALRIALVELLDVQDTTHARIVQHDAALLHKAADCVMHLSAAIGDYTDFYAGIHHATNVGKLFRPDNPLLPNYKHVPIGYHGRASSIGVSGAAVRRPVGQMKPRGAVHPSVGPSRRLDFELEVGVWIGPGNPLGSPIAIGNAHRHIAGLCLLNDWSARDIQAWEYEPLGPFLAKSFATTISPWVVMPEALAPFRVALTRPKDDPAPFDYLRDADDLAQGSFNVDLDVFLLTAKMKAGGLAAQQLTHSNMRHLYWTVAQMVAHHTSGGCNLRPGDLFGTGTISGPGADACGSLLELSQGGAQPIALTSGETRTFLEDGDTVIFKARCHRQGFASIGFGECVGTIAPALASRNSL